MATIWPEPVTFDDDVPKRGCARITLSIPELRIKKSMGIFGTATAENGKLELNFTSSTLCVTFTLTQEEEKIYKYEKNLPEDIKSAEIKPSKGKVEVKLSKTENVTWQAHTQHFCME